MKALALPIFIVLLHAPAYAEFLVISGRVLDTASEKDDRPLGKVTVDILDAKGNVLKTGRTNAEGKFFIETDDKDLKGTEKLRVKMPGYAAHPTTMQLNLKRPAGMKLAYQGEILLTDEKAMLNDSEYRKTVAKNVAVAQKEPAQADRARAALASIAGLPTASKEVAFGSIKAQSSQAYSALLKVDQEVTRTKELEFEFRQKGVLVVPTYDPKGQILLSGSVATQAEKDDVLMKAGQKGFPSKAIINDIRIQRP